MEGLTLKSGQCTSVAVATRPNQLSAAISQSITDTYCQPHKSSHLLPAITLAGSLVTAAGVHADSSILTVENLNDNGAGSLRDVVGIANSRPGPDVIVFEDDLSGTLSLYSGEIDITDSVIIQGLGEAELTIDAQGNSRIFDILHSEISGAVEINDITLANGSTLNIDPKDTNRYAYNGGAIRAQTLPRIDGGLRREQFARLTLNDVTFTNNAADPAVATTTGNGGAVFTLSHVLEVNDSTFLNNSAFYSGGGVFSDGGALEVNSSLFMGNTAGYYGVGDSGGIQAISMYTATIDSSQFLYNQGGAYAGGIGLRQISSRALISNSTISGNTAFSAGGVGIENSRINAVTEISNSIISNNTSTAYGAGINCACEGLIISNNTQITDNSAGYAGGGITFNDGTPATFLHIEDSVISGNTAGTSVTSNRGARAGRGNGGGIHFYVDDGSLLIRNSEITGNSAVYGGGLAFTYLDNGSDFVFSDITGSVTLENTTITGNTASNDGGGIRFLSETIQAPVLITDSTISNNSSGDNGGGLSIQAREGLSDRFVIQNTVIDANTAVTNGGGLWFTQTDGSHNVEVISSTISNNIANSNGGGIHLSSDDNGLFLRNSTLSGNSAIEGSGGGLYLAGTAGASRIDNSTIVNNYSYQNGGGVVNNANDNLLIRSSIIANNSVNEGSGNDISGNSLYADFSLIGSLDGAVISGNNNILYLDPALGELDDNGGPTFTHALSANSPAIDSGLNISSVINDQRGEGFGRMTGLQTDIGAFESDTDIPAVVPAATLTVTNLNDSGAGSLRDTINIANAAAGLDVIDFDAGLNGTITLASGPLSITDDLVIDDTTNSITIDGGFVNVPRRGESGSRHLVIGEPVNVTANRGPTFTDDLLSVNLVGLTLTNGVSNTRGGAIYARNTELGLTDITIQNNQAVYGGGGLYAGNNSVVRILDSTISGNAVTGSESAGGGIALSGSSLVMRGDNQITGNIATQQGGGVSAVTLYSMMIDSATITYNSSATGGGLNVSESAGSILISNSIIDYNSATSYAGGVNVNGVNNAGDGITLSSSSVNNNVSAGDAGGINTQMAQSVRILDNSSVSNNVATDSAGGVRFIGDSANTLLEITNSTVSNNTAQTGDGGGLTFLSNTASLSVNDSIVTGNITNNDGGGIFININPYEGPSIQFDNSQITSNEATTGNGGGLHFESMMTVTTTRFNNATISNNVAGNDGGGLHLIAYLPGSPLTGGFYGGFVISDSNILNNTAIAGSGGAINLFDRQGNDGITIQNSTIAGNTAFSAGGGIALYATDGRLLMLNSTISGNAVTDDVNGKGGGLYVQQSVTSTIANSTITNNSAASGGGIYGNEPMFILSSIVAGNSATTNGNDITGDTFISAGPQIGLFMSILGTELNNAANDNGFNHLNTASLLAPLTDNDGPTQTHMPMPASPAINSGFNFVAASTDQRLEGFARTIGGATDRGAFETTGTPALNLVLTNSPFPEDGGVANVGAESNQILGQTTFIDLSFSGEAILDTDFAVDCDILVIPAGTAVSAATAAMTGIDDPVFEGDEEIDIDGTTMMVPGPIAPVTAIIFDNEGPPLVTLSLADSPLLEDGGVAIVTATLSSVAAVDVTANLVLTGTASPTDYTLATSIVIPAGMSSADIDLTGINDLIDEDDETVIIDIDTVVNGLEDGEQQVTAVIIDDDEPLVSLSLVGNPIPEDNGMSTITATLSNITTQDVTTTLAFSGTATFGTDFISPTSILIPAGSPSADIVLTATDEGIPAEGDETVIVDIDTVTNAIEDGVQQVTTTIVEDDTLVRVNLTVSEINEGNIAQAILTLTEPVSNDVTIGLGFTGTASMPEDYTVASTSVFIPAGETTGAVDITVNADSVFDPNETVIVDIISVDGGIEDGEQRDSMVILDMTEAVEVPALSDWGKWLIALLLPLAGLLGLRRNKKSGA